MDATTASTGSSSGAAVLGPKALNRALLARQLLLRRVRQPVSEVLAHLVGLQAQSPDAPYYGLWSRLAGFRAAELAELLTDRRAVRATLWRGTLHAVTSEDCLTLRMLAQPGQERAVRTNTDYDGTRIAGRPVAELLATAEELLAEQPCTAAELRARLTERWPGCAAGKLGFADGSMGRQMELQAIASCVLGGCLLAGGRVSLTGALMGAFVLSSIQSYLVVMAVKPQWFILLLGLIVVFAAYGDQRFREWASKP